MSLIKGIGVVLYDRVLTGHDQMGRELYEEEPVLIENVLVAPVSSNDVTDRTDLSGKKAVYTLAIPKGDTHIWEDRTVEFFGMKWQTVGFSTMGIDSLIPLDWNRKVTVARYG